MFDFLRDYGPVGVVILFGVGVAALLLGRFLLIQSVSCLALAIRLPERLIGLGLLPFCTCAPYWMIALAAARHEHPSVAVGTVIGCSLINICLILGVATFFGIIRVPRLLLYRDLPLLALLPGCILILAYLGGSGDMKDIVAGRATGRLFPLVGAVLLFCLGLYLVRAVAAALRGKSDAEFLKQIEEGVRSAARGNTFQAPLAWGIAVVCELIIGAGMLVVGGDALIKSGMFAAKGLGVNELQISLGLISAGLSLPLFAAVASDVFRQQSERALDMIVVANIFNLLGVLGLTALLTHRGLVIDSQVMQYDLPMLFIASILVTVFGFTGQKYRRGEGVFLLAIYGFYFLLLVLTVVSES